MAILKLLPVTLRSKVVAGKLPGIKGISIILDHLEGKEINVTFDYYVRKRSNAQNSYYWPVCVEYCLEGLVDIGYKRSELSPEIVHDYLKGKLLKHMKRRRIYNPETKTYITKIPKSSELTTWEFIDYVEVIGQWAATYLSIQIPEPDKEWKEQAEKNYQEALLKGIITEDERNRVRIALKLAAK